MRKIRLDKRIRYQGNGDGWPAAPPNYFQRLSAKYTSPEASCPDWLGRYFPDKNVQQGLISVRRDAVYYYIEAAKLQMRTTTGWHAKRNVAELRVLGGRLARLRNRPGREPHIAQLESEIRARRWRPVVARRQFEDLLQYAQYRWRTAMFEVTEYLKAPGRSTPLPSCVIRGLCDWLSFPEIGIRCTPEAIRAIRRHFYIERSNDKSYRVYRYQPLRNENRESATGLEKEASWEQRVLLNSSFRCHRCGASMAGKELGRHLEQVEQIPVKLVALRDDRDELYQIDTEETLASWMQECS